jgi:hypothetical protein
LANIIKKYLEVINDQNLDFNKLNHTMNKVKNILTRYSSEKENLENRVNKENYEKDKIEREALEKKEKV